MAPIIELEEVTKTYGRPGRVRPAVAGVSFSVAEGELALLTGPSGAGKSTLLKLILAMERPDRGVVRVAGRDVQRLSKGSIPYLRRNVGVVFQDFQLLPEATPRENVALALHVLGTPGLAVRARVDEVLEQVDLDPGLKRPVRTLSGGEQQRVAIARALASEPAVLLADEPTGNLDPQLTADILQLFERIRDAGTSILMATHDPQVMQALSTCPRVHLVQGQRVSCPAGARVDRNGVVHGTLDIPGPAADKSDSGDVEAVA